MFAYVWPLALVVLSNIVYQICAKSTPTEIHPLASVTVSYLVAAAVSALLYFITAKDASFVRELGQVNWATFALGVCIIGLEAGYIYAYKAGWPISTAAIVQSAFLAVALVLAGFVIYHEALTETKLIGVVICLVGLVFLNK